MKFSSEKQAKKVREYNKICAKLDRESDGICFITGEPLPPRPEHHHLYGRDGDLIIDEKYIVCVLPGHAIWWHSFSISELSLMPWWEYFIGNLKEKAQDDKMYHKLYLKYSEV